MSEQFDILTETGEMTGKREERPIVHRTGLWHRTIHLWVINSKHELLIQKRTMDKLSYPGLWDISVAGHVTAGDDSLTTAIKEAREELGLFLNTGDIEYLFTIWQKDVTNNGTYVDNEISDVYLTNKDIDTGNLTMSDEVEEVHLIAFTELEKKINAGDMVFVPHVDEYERLFRILHDRYDS